MLFLRFILFLHLYLISTSCATAAIVDGDVIKVDDLISLRHSFDPDWKLIKNRSFLGNYILYFRETKRGTMITIEIRRMEKRAASIPLRVLATAMWTNFGRGRGIVSNIKSIQRIEVDGRESFAITGERWTKTKRELVSTVYIKLFQHLVIISLSADRNLPEGPLRFFESILENLEILDMRGYDPNRIIEDGVEF